VQSDFREIEAPRQPEQPVRDFATAEEFLSPFDDELDIPTFLRRSAD